MNVDAYHADPAIGGTDLRKLRRGKKRKPGEASIVYHGETRNNRVTPEYRAWVKLRGRCNNQNDKWYPHYGGRGIAVCDRWNYENGFVNFLEDMGRRPSNKHSIDRIDNDGGYSPDNCRWATIKEQNRNQSHRKRIDAFGLSLTAVEWAERNGLNPWTVTNRMLQGWSAERAVSTPVDTSVGRPPKRSESIARRAKEQSNHG